MKPSHLVSPWGRIQQRDYYGPDGIQRIHTASHGGFFVPLALVHRIPAEQRAEAARWSGSEQWYEEDVCAEYVIRAFPETFPSPDKGDSWPWVPVRSRSYADSDGRRVR